MGTKRYQAPEIIEGKRLSAAEVDIFSLGVILFLMVVGKMPYQTVASPNDPFYKSLVDHNHGSFWSKFDEPQLTTPELGKSSFRIFLIEVYLLLCLLIGPLFK